MGQQYAVQDAAAGRTPSNMAACPAGETPMWEVSKTDEDYKFTPSLYVPKVADCPKPEEIQRCLNGMRIVQRDSEGDFVDSEGNFVRIPRRDDDSPKASQLLGLPYARVFGRWRAGTCCWVWTVGRCTGVIGMTRDGT